MANGLKRVQYRSDFVPPSDCDTVYYAEKDDEVAYMRIAAALLVLADDSRLRIGSPIIGNGYISTPQYDECGGSEGTVDTENGVSLNDIKSLILPDETVFLNGETNQLFMNCTALEHIELPSNLENLGESIFSKCSGLTSITIPESVSGIGEYAFDECDSLSSITIPDSVISIGDSAFYNCSALSSIVIGSGVTTIGSDVFGECPNLVSVVLQNGLTSIPTGLFVQLENMTYVSIPGTVNDISGLSGNNNLCQVDLGYGISGFSESAFDGCSALSSITIPNSVMSIGDYAFRSCSALSSILIPDSVMSIGAEAFEYCDGLSSITLGSGVTNVGSAAFSNCSSLTTIRIMSTHEIDLQTALDVDSSYTIYVPLSKVDYYTNHFTGEGWENVTIEPMS